MNSLQDIGGDVVSERLKGTLTRILNQSLQEFKSSFLGFKPGATRGSFSGARQGEHWFACLSVDHCLLDLPLYC